MPSTPRPLPAVGTSFGRWTVIGENPQYRLHGTKQQRFVKVKCNCGTCSWVALSRLIGGYSRSCGCLRKDKHNSFMKWKVPLPKSFEA